MAESAAVVAGISLNRFADEVLETCEATRKRPSTRAALRHIFHEVRRLPGVSLVSDLTPATVRRLVNWWMKQELRRTTIDSNLRELRGICGYATRWGYLEANPVDAEEDWLPGYRGLPLSPRPDSLSDRDVSRLLIQLQDASTTWEGHRLFALVGTIVYAGLSRNEALSLSWARCDLDERALIVEGGCAWWRRRREIPLKLAEILDQWRPLCGSEWVFPGAMLVGPWTGGGPKSRPIARLKAAGQAAGIEELTFKRLLEFWEDHSPGLKLPDFESEQPPERRHGGPVRPKPGPKPSNPPPVWDFSRGPGRRPFFRGELLPIKLYQSEIAVIRAMVNAGCLEGCRLTEPDLQELSGYPNAGRVLRRLKKRAPFLENEILCPGKKSSGGYGLAGR